MWITWIFLYISSISIESTNNDLIYGLKSIQHPNINITGLTITSLNYNRHGNIPDWIDFIFGSKALYYNKTYTSFTTWEGKARARTPIQPGEVEYAHDIVKQKLTTVLDSKPHASSAQFFNNPTCSLELLGFMQLDRTYPFFRSHKLIEPIINTATLHVLSSEVVCLYRVMYENWRMESVAVKVHFWSIIFYCPSFTRELCNEINDKMKGKEKQEFAMMIEMKADEETMIRNSFIGSIYDKKTDPNQFNIG